MSKVSELLARAKEEGILFHSEIQDALQQSDGEGRTLGQIADMVEELGIKVVNDLSPPDISKNRIREIEARALSKLRKPKDDDDTGLDAL